MTIFAKKSIFKKSVLAVLMGTSLLLAACNDKDDDNSQPAPSKPLDYSKNFKGVSVYKDNEGIPITDLSDQAIVQIMHYDMPNVLDQRVEATALIMTPKTPMPKDGWRMVVWEHGTIGSGDQCAQSRAGVHNDYLKPLFAQLLAAGYVIVSPDYEGSGTPGIHPYLNMQSAARSAIHAMNAFKDAYKGQVNGAWMSVGHSQGGQASLGTAEYANSDVNYKGGIAVAPASNLDMILLDVAPDALSKIDAQEAAGGVPLAQRTSVEVYSALLSYAAFVGVGITAYQPDFDYNKMFHKESQASTRKAAGDDGLCLGPLKESYKQDILTYLGNNPGKKVMDFPGVDEVAMRTDPIIVDFLKNRSQPGTKKIDKPILVIQGIADASVPYPVTKMMVDGLKKLSPDNKDISLMLVPDAGHIEAFMWKHNDMAAFIKAHMPNPAS